MSPQNPKTPKPHINESTINWVRSAIAFNNKLVHLDLNVLKYYNWADLTHSIIIENNCVISS